MVKVKSMQSKTHSATKNIPKKIIFIVNFLSLIVYGSALFVGGACLYPKFVDLINSLTSVSSASIWFYGLGWIVTFCVGIAWLCCLLMFEAAKNELLTLMRK
jgi:hypothetical protein